MAIIATLHIPKPKERKVNAPPTRIMRDRRNRRPKDARKKREFFQQD